MLMCSFVWELLVDIEFKLVVLSVVYGLYVLERRMIKNVDFDFLFSNLIIEFYLFKGRELFICRKY